MAEIKVPSLTLNGVGNLLAGAALAFLVDRLALGGIVAKTLPAEIVGLTGYLIFAGAAYYGWKLASRAS